MSSPEWTTRPIKKQRIDFRKTQKQTSIPTSINGSWRNTPIPITRKRSRSKSPISTNPNHVHKYCPLKDGPLTNYNTGDGVSVQFRTDSGASCYVYPYIEYYQYEPYMETSIYTHNTRIRTSISDSNSNLRQNRHSNRWLIPIGSTLARFQAEHQLFIQSLKRRSDYDKLYVCGIAYKTSTDDSRVADIQLTLTGTVDEPDATRVAQKEIREEIGLDVALHHIESVGITTKNGRQTHLFIVSASDCSLFKEEAVEIEKSLGTTTKNKVVVAIVGTRAELFALLSQARDRKSTNNKKDLNNIDGIILTKLTDVEALH